MMISPRRASRPRRRSPVRSPQAIINRFWKPIIASRKSNGVTTTLPRNTFAERIQEHIAQSVTVAESVDAGYDRAANECRAKVDQIASECRRLNQKYCDPYFDLVEQDYDCRNSLPTKTPLIHPDDESVTGEDPIPSSNQLRLTVLVRDNKIVDCTEQIIPAPPLPRTPLGPLPLMPLPEPVPPAAKRINYIFDNPQFYVDGASADDVRQGNEGDCWFLCALAALCTMQNEINLVKKVCVKYDEKVGVYGYVFFRDGEWRSEIVDDILYLNRENYEDIKNDRHMLWMKEYFPSTGGETYRKKHQNNSEALFYAKSAHPDETWVPLIEKAYAKAHGDYRSIKDGFIGESVEDLTGGVSSYFLSEDLVDQEEFWNEGLSKVNKDFLFGCQTGRLNFMDNRGLETRHAYSILDARTLKEKESEKEFRLLKVRNPWGKDEWTGAWSDKSDMWTPERRELLQHKDKDDGVFWITYEDLLRYYPVIYRTRIFDSSWTVVQQWTSVQVPVLPAETYEKTFEVTISTKTTAVIVLSQLDGRYFRGLEGQYTFIPYFRLHKEGDEKYLLRTHGRYPDERSINAEVDLEIGTYQVLVRLVGKRDSSKYRVEDAIQQHWNERRSKLLQVGLSYDLAHAKVPFIEVEEDEGDDTDFNLDERIDIRRRDSRDLDSDDGSDHRRRPTDPNPRPLHEVTPVPADCAPPGTRERRRRSPRRAFSPVRRAISPAEDPWNAVCVVGLRVYSKDPNAKVTIVPKAQLTEKKQIVLDVDHPGKDATKDTELAVNAQVPSKGEVGEEPQRREETESAANGCNEHDQVFETSQAARAEKGDDTEAMALPGAEALKPHEDMAENDFSTSPPSHTQASTPNLSSTKAQSPDTTSVLPEIDAAASHQAEGTGNVEGLRSSS